MEQGQIVLINGTSSAGKTTLVKAIQDLSNRPFHAMSLDQFRDGMPERFRGLSSPAGTTGSEGINVVAEEESTRTQTRIKFGTYGRLTLEAMRRAIKSVSDHGINVLIDDMITERADVLDYVGLFQDRDFWCVGLTCTEEILLVREASRPGRFPGTAAAHMRLVHEWMQYDLELDTSTVDVYDCARRVLTTISNNRRNSRAVTRMKREFQV